MSSDPSPKKQEKQPEGSTALGTIALPISTLTSLLRLQDVEDHKPRLSKISWLPDVLVFRSSIIPTVLGPVLTITLFSTFVAFVSLYWNIEVGLTNNVVPLLSVVVALLLVFRNSSAYERYAEGRKDFTALISNARNLSRLVWVSVCVPAAPSADSGANPIISRPRLTEEKKRLIRLVVAFVVATKHHLRAEGGLHHADLKAGASLRQLKQANCQCEDEMDAFTPSVASRSPLPPSPSPIVQGDNFFGDEESALGLINSHSGPVASPQSMHHSSRPPSALHPSPSVRSDSFRQSVTNSARKHLHLSPRAGLKRRPTAVRVVMPEGYTDRPPVHDVHVSASFKRSNERTPLIKAGVKPDVRSTHDDVMASQEALKANRGVGGMVELGLPLILAHEISRTIFRWRRMGLLETIGPAGMNSMQAILNSMTEQLGAMERMQTPLPVIFGVHLKQTVTLFLFILPFTLVDVLGWKMIIIITCCAFTMMGVEHIAAQVEMPFGTDPCDLNLDLFCTELLCECEAILERLPEGDEDDHAIYLRSNEQFLMDEMGGDDDGGDAD